MRFRQSSYRLPPVAVAAAIILSCSCQKPAGDDSTRSPADPGTQHVLQRLVANLVADSGGRAPVDPAAPAQAPVPEPPLTEPSTGDLEGGVCPPDTGPITVLVLPNAQAVRRASSQYADEPVLHRDAETVIFETGRVITSQVETVSDRLNELGWGGRDLQLIGTMPRRFAFAGGNNAGSSSESPTNQQPKKKRRRRRG